MASSLPEDDNVLSYSQPQISKQRTPCHTCERCQVITIHVPSQTKMSELGTGGKFNFARVSGAYVQASSADCLFFQWAISEFHEMHEGYVVDEAWTLNVGLLEGHGEQHPDFPFLDVSWDHCDDAEAALTSRWLTILAEPDNEAARFISRRPENLDISSTIAFNTFRNWVGVCDESHLACRPKSESFMPSNILQIANGMSQNPTIRVVRHPPREEYVALSYCWGEGQSVKATTSTIGVLEQNVSYLDLPESLKDAIRVTSELRCRLLWVDILCIIQDDDAHVAKEIALMPEIYENAYTTIIAARSRSCEQGFLQDITFPTPSSHVFRFPIRGYGLKTGSILCFAETANRHIRDPIEDRAWPFQEFLTSRRILRFGAYQVAWQCLTSRGAHRNDTAPNWWTQRETDKFDMQRNFQRRYPILSDNYTDEFRAWMELVEDYTIRNLSKPGDRLLAISGIAAKLAGYSGQTKYIGGLWVRHLPRALLWEVVSGRDPRPDSYVAPTWSWASIRGRISMACGQDSEDDPDLRILSVEDCALAEPTAPYGNLKRASITVHGWVRELYWRNSGSSLVETNEDDPKETFAFASPDSTEDEEYEMLPVLCLQVCQHSSHDGPHGLILTEENGNVLKRRGCFTFFRWQYENESFLVQDAQLESMRCWKDLCIQRTVTIV